MDAPGQIEMKNGLPLIEYRKGRLGSEPTQRCPTGAIVWLDADVGPVKGRAARKIVRQGEIHDAPA